MKKLICLILASLFVLALAGCGGGDDSKKDGATEKSTSAQEKKENTEETVTLKTTVNNLVANGAKCTTDIFYAGTLNYKNEPVKGNLCPVEDERFTSYAQLEEFVRNTYIKELADGILGGTEGGSTIYTDVAGTLCIDTYSILSRGYFVDWSGCTVSDPELDESKERCTFTVTAAITEPGESNIPEPYKLEASAVKVDGKWLLETIIK